MNEKLIKEVVDKHKADKNVISILQSLQDTLGYIPEKELSIIARRLDVPLVKFYGVATFYSQFKLVKPGKYMIRICNGTACHVNTSEALIEVSREFLNIREGETTHDGLFTLELVNCIGACAKAPAAMINYKVYGNLTPQKFKNLLNDLQHG